MAERIVYLDHAATTPLRAEALAAMLPHLEGGFANPSGSHRLARAARRAVDEARDVVAGCLGADPGEIVFTSGGTESDNTAIAGVLRPEAGRALCPATEHHAVLGPVEHFGGKTVPVDPQGRVDLDALAGALDDDVRLVSVMAVNNETGTIQPVAEVARLVHRLAPRAVVHTDAVQAPLWLDLRPLAAASDLLSLSAHKFGGPKGVGVLRIRGGLTLEPLLLGGGQERDRRSGTHNVAGIVGTARALQLADAERDETVTRVGVLRDRLVDALVTGAGAVELVEHRHKVAGNAHVCFPEVENEALLFLIDEHGVCASAASACASGAMEPSHVLAAMGVDRSLAGGALRMTLGRETTSADVDAAIGVVGDAVAHLRAGRRELERARHVGTPS